MSSNEPLATVGRMLTRLGAGSVLRNYIVPGLHSTLLATTPAGGKLRMFTMTRDQELYVLPHSHRYAFSCFVVAGRVDQILYSVSVAPRSQATHCIAPYHHKDRTPGVLSEYVRASSFRYTYKEGDWYHMQEDAFHSIVFYEGAKVLMFEQPATREVNEVLLPVVDGELCDTFFWADWMMEAHK